LPVESQETEMPDTLHGLVFVFRCKSPSGKYLPAWLKRKDSSILRKHLRGSKNYDLVKKFVLQSYRQIRCM